MIGHIRDYDYYVACSIRTISMVKHTALHIAQGTNGGYLEGRALMLSDMKSNPIVKRARLNARGW